MSDNSHPEPGSDPSGPQWPGLSVTPVLLDDPAKIGDFWLDARVTARPSGAAWLAHSGMEGATDTQRVIVVQLSEGAAADKAARDRFSGLINKLHIDDVSVRGGQEQDEGRLGRRFVERDEPVDPDDVHPLAPWVALHLSDDAAAVQIADDLLAQVDLMDLAPVGQPTGPDFRLHWAERDDPGHNRIWPLPWPGRHDRAGWLSILVSMLLMLALAAVAVLIAILLFKDSPPTSPPPQAQSTAQSSDDSSASEDTPPPQETASPSPESASPSPDPDESGGGGSPTPPSRL